jgi:hypothetical protein
MSDGFTKAPSDWERADEKLLKQKNVKVLIAIGEIQIRSTPTGKEWRRLP